MGRWLPWLVAGIAVGLLVATFGAEMLEDLGEEEDEARLSELDDLACAGGQIVRFDAENNDWACADLPGAAPQLTLYDATGTEVGPVLSVFVADEPGHEDTDLAMAVVAITRSDAAGNFHTALQRVTRGAFVDHFTQGFGIRFDGPSCTGNAYMSKDDLEILGLPELYSPSMTLTVPSGIKTRLYVATGSEPETVAVQSVLESRRCEQEVYQEANLYRAERLIDDMKAAYPPPFRLSRR